MKYCIGATVLVLLLTACSAGNKNTDGDAPGAPVRVINRHWLSMEVYVGRTGQRVRLGRLKSGETDTFWIPGYLLTTATALQFSMESSGPSPVILSEQILVVPGEEVVLVIPNTR